MCAAKLLPQPKQRALALSIGIEFAPERASAAAARWCRLMVGSLLAARTLLALSAVGAQVSLARMRTPCCGVWCRLMPAVVLLTAVTTRVPACSPYTLLANGRCTRPLATRGIVPAAAAAAVRICDGQSLPDAIRISCWRCLPAA